jgi:hypothetical protein
MPLDSPEPWRGHDAGLRSRTPSPHPYSAAEGRGQPARLPTDRSRAPTCQCDAAEERAKSPHGPEPSASPDAEPQESGDEDGQLPGGSEPQDAAAGKLEADLDRLEVDTPAASQASTMTRLEAGLEGAESSGRAESSTQGRQDTMRRSPSPEVTRKQGPRGNRRQDNAYIQPHVIAGARLFQSSCEAVPAFNKHFAC